MPDIRHFYFALLLFTLLASASHAQSSAGLDSDIGNPGLGGRNTIQGRIYYPSGHPLDRRVRVKVSSVRGGPASIMTDDNGSFTIQRLTDGTYNLTVDAGSEYETATESVQIIEGGGRGGPGQTVFVQINLRLKASTGNQPGLVNAARANVPKAARDLYEQALASSQAGDHKKAIEQLKKAVSLFPDFLLALNELGMQYLQINELDHAAESLRAALKQAPDEFIMRLNYGLVLLQQKKYAESESELRSAIEKNDSSAPAHEYHGRALIGLRRLDEAEKELQRALALGGDEAANSHRYLGAIYIQRGEDARARAELQEYLRLRPKVRDAEEIRQIIRDLSAKQPPKQKE
jgi:Tfp pilus assembly protein PilF